MERASERHPVQPEWHTREFLRISTLTPKGLQSAVRNVLNNPQYRTRAQECARELARVDGLRHATEIVEAAVTRRERFVRGTT